MAQEKQLVAVFELDDLADTVLAGFGRGAPVRVEVGTQVQAQVGTEVQLEAGGDIQPLLVPEPVALVIETEVEANID